MNAYQIHQGDALAVLRMMEADSVDCCITSPPYWGLRSYDENAVVIDPHISAETKQWLETELIKRGVRAR